MAYRARLEKTRRRSRSDLAYFCTRFLKKHFPLKLATFQRDMMRTSDQLTGGRRDCVEVPREHGKSTIRSFATPLRAAVTGEKKFIVLVCDTAAQAQTYLANIKAELDDNEDLREVFGDLGSKTAKKWGAREIVLANGCIIVAFGLGTSPRGLLRKADGQLLRPDLILVDDIQSHEDCDSHERREKAWRWFRRGLIPAGQKGRCDILVTGTRVHRYCVTAKIAQHVVRRKVSDEVGDNGKHPKPSRTTWTHTKHRAMTDRKPLWPAKYSPADLDGIREDIGTTAYAGEYNNDPRSDEESLFRPEWLRHENPPHEMRLGRYLFMDPARGETKKADFTAVIELVRCEEGKWIRQTEEEEEEGRPRELNPYHGVSWVTRAWIEKKPYHEGAQVMFEWAADGNGYGPAVIVGFEDETYGAIYREMQGMLEEENVDLPLQAIHHSKNKIKRITATLQPPVQTGRLRFATHLADTELEQQLLDLPRGSHDDGPDALEGAYTLAARPQPGLWTGSDDEDEDDLDDEDD